MADDNKLAKYNYNPEAIDICEFDITVDHLHWKLLCKKAQELATTPSHLLATVLEHFLVKIGALDPKAPSTEGYKVGVTIKELRDNPSELFNFRKNTALKDEPELDVVDSFLNSLEDDEDVY